MNGIREQAALLALISHSNLEWYRVATAIEERGSAFSILAGDWTGFETFSLEPFDAIAKRVTEEDLSMFQRLIQDQKSNGVRLLTVLDEDYPANLRQIYNRPPFLFIRGSLAEVDAKAVAVVGTRRATPLGLEAASSLATALADRGVTVISGLARGIDTAAHKASLDAGGRTLAVMGTGIERIYPKENRVLATEILSSDGALISQFWPDAPPTRSSFPMRNVVMSGMAIGTVVIEANSTSGAKMQARLALEHGKHLFLLRSLVLQEEWATKYAQHGGTTVVDSEEDILAVLDTTIDPPRQLALG
jgi:DNA processing protein